MPQSMLDRPVYSSFGDDPDLSELVELFVQEMPERIGKLAECYDRSDWDQLGRAAHQIKGAAGSYGFGQLTPYAARLEAAVRNRQPEEAIEQSLRDLLALCRAVRVGAPTTEATL